MATLHDSKVCKEFESLRAYLRTYVCLYACVKVCISQHRHAYFKGVGQHGQNFFMAAQFNTRKLHSVMSGDVNHASTYESTCTTVSEQQHSNCCHIVYDVCESSVTITQCCVLSSSHHNLLFHILLESTGTERSRVNVDMSYSYVYNTNPKIARVRVRTREFA